MRSDCEVSRLNMKNVSAENAENAESAEKADDLALERTLSLVRRLIEKIELQIEAKDAKGSIADYIKLLQLQKEMEERRFRRIEVKWVDID